MIRICGLQLLYSISEIIGNFDQLEPLIGRTMKSNVSKELGRDAVACV